MKRYVLFTWTDHEAKGGWNDLRNVFDTVEAAIEAGQKWASADYDWSCWHVVDIQTATIVAED